MAGEIMVGDVSDFSAFMGAVIDKESFKNIVSYIDYASKSDDAEIVVGVPLIASGILLFFARRRETTRALGVITAVLGVLTILIPTSIVGTCVNDQMVCNREMKPTLLIAGGITVALGLAVLVVGEMKREHGGGGDATSA